MLGQAFEAKVFAFYECCEASGQFVYRYRVSHVLLKFLFAVDRLAEAIFVAYCSAVLFFICMIAALLCATVNLPRILFAAVRCVCGRDHGERCSLDRVNLRPDLLPAGSCAATLKAALMLVNCGRWLCGCCVTGSSMGACTWIFR